MDYQMSRNPAVEIIQGEDAAISQARTRGCRYIIITGQDERMPLDITGQDERMPLYHRPGREDAAILQARTRGCRYITGQDETEDAARYHWPGREDAAR